MISPQSPLLHEWPADPDDPLICIHGCGVEPHDVLAGEECPARLRAFVDATAFQGRKFDEALATMREHAETAERHQRAAETEATTQGHRVITLREGIAAALGLAEGSPGLASDVELLEDLGHAKRLYDITSRSLRGVEEELTDAGCPACDSYAAGVRWLRRQGGRDDNAREIREALGLSAGADGYEAIAEIRRLRAAAVSFYGVAEVLGWERNGKAIVDPDLASRKARAVRAGAAGHNTLRNGIAHALGYGDGAGTTTDADLVAELRQRVDGAREDALADETLQIARILGIDTAHDYDLLSAVREVAGLALIGVGHRIRMTRAALDADRELERRLAGGLVGGAS